MESDDFLPRIEADAAGHRPRRATADPESIQRLGVRFLLAWTAATCLFLAWSRQYIQQRVAAEVVVMLLMGVLIGATWGGRLLMTWNRLSFGRCRRSPGEWLLAARALPVLLAVLCRSLPPDFQPRAALSAATLLAFTSFMLGLASVALHRPHWRLPLILLVVIHLIRMLEFLWPPSWPSWQPGAGGTWLHAASALVVALAAWRYRQRDQGSLHWLGVWLWVLWETALLTGAIQWTLERLE